MSEHSVTVVRLDPLPDSGLACIADAVQAWLVEQAVVETNSRFHSLWQPSRWMPGPRFIDHVEPESWLDGFMNDANNGVDIASAWNAYHPVANDEPPTCPQCATPAPEVYTETYSAWVTRWYEGRVELFFTCANCSWFAPVGDWSGEFSLLIGTPAVTFHNWPELRPGLISSIRDLLGGRTGVVRCHL